MATFEALEKWKSEFLERIDSKDLKSFPFIVIGNKSDKEGRKVSKERGRTWATNIGAEFFETSAKDAINIEESFMKCIDLVQRKHSSKLSTIEIEVNTDKQSLRLNKATKDKSKCC